MRVESAVEGARGPGEDRIRIEEDPEGIWLILADGAGGTTGGREAAELLVRALDVPPTGEGPLEYLCAAWLEARDQEMWRAAEPGEAAAVLLRVSRGGVAGASVGDCEAWVLGPDSRTELTAHQQRKPRLGTGRALPVPFAAEWGTGARLVIASDGVWAGAPYERTLPAALVSSPEQLVELVRYPSGELPDDVSVVVVHRE